MTETTKPKWALILGASSGFGAASSLALARNGFNIVGVHLDRRATAANAEKTCRGNSEMGRQALFFNVNAADPERRSEVIEACRQSPKTDPGCDGIRLMLHSLAFGTLKPYIADGACRRDQARRYEHDAGCHGSQSRLLDPGSVCGRIAARRARRFLP